MKGKISPWVISTIVLVIIVISLATFQLTGRFVSDNQSAEPTEYLSADQAATKAIEYLNNNLVQPGTSASLVSVEEMNGVYKVITSYQGQEISVYITKDGGYLFLQGFDTSEEIQKPETQPEEKVYTIGNFLVNEGEICKENGKPIIYFFGSERCPHCTWEHPIINNVTENFEGYISYHENMDTDKDMDVFSKYSTGGIPTLVWGCRYSRVGSGESFGKEQEENVLIALTCKLTDGMPTDVCNKPEIKQLISQI